MRYVMKNEGYPYKIIYAKRAKVGRVFKHADGTFHAFIGKTTASGHATEQAAFGAVVAKACGFNNEAELRGHNSAVRSRIRQRNQNARALANRFLNGSLDDQMKILDKLFGA